MRLKYKIYFIRHGQTDWNVTGRFQGTRDIEINSVGRHQARLNGMTLRRILNNPKSLNYISSPLSRARETMEIILQVLQLEKNTYNTEKRLSEINFGTWEGRCAAELKNNAADLYNMRRADKMNFRPPMGETYGELSQRTISYINTVERDTVIVAHGGIMRVLSGYLLGLSVESIPNLEIPQDKVMVWDGETIYFEPS